MSLDPIQLDYRRLRAREERKEQILLTAFALCSIGMAALAGLGLAAFLYYVNHP